MSVTEALQMVSTIAQARDTFAVRLLRLRVFIVKAVASLKQQRRDARVQSDTYLQD